MSYIKGGVCFDSNFQMDLFPDVQDAYVAELIERGDLKDLNV